MAVGLTHANKPIEDLISLQIDTLESTSWVAWKNIQINGY